FEGQLGTQRLDGGVHAATAGDLENLLDHVHFAEVERHVRPHLAGDRQALLDPVDHDDAAGAAKLGARGGAKSDGALGEDRHDIANLDIGLFRAAKAGGHDVRAHQYLSVGQAVG